MGELARLVPRSWHRDWNGGDPSAHRLCHARFSGVISQKPTLRAESGKLLERRFKSLPDGAYGCGNEKLLDRLLIQQKGDISMTVCATSGLVRANG
jgi:hypothetical protein